MDNLAPELCRWINSKKVLGEGITAYSFGISLSDFLTDFYKFTNGNW